VVDGVTVVGLTNLPASMLVVINYPA